MKIDAAAKTELKDDTEKFVGSKAGKIFTGTVAVYNALSFLAGLIQIWIVTQIRYGDRFKIIQTLFELLLVPVPTGAFGQQQEEIIFIACLISNVLSSACIAYVTGRVLLEPKYAAGSPTMTVH